MRLTLDNFFSHLIFHPFEADTKKERMIALVISIACGIFLVGLCHAICAVRRCYTYRPPEKANDQDRRVGELKDMALGISPKGKFEEPKVDIQVTIPAEVKATLDKLFEGTPYSIDSLPVYPIRLNEKHCKPKRKVMTAPVMKGTSDDGRPFIAIKVDCILSDEDIERNATCYDEVQRFYTSHRHVKEVLVLYQYHKEGPLFWGGEGKFLWDQLGSGLPICPSFFTWNFTYAEDGTGPTASQKDNFVSVNALLKAGSQDKKGLSWHIPES